MSIDLILGFEKLPDGFEVFIRARGFRFESRRKLSDSGIASTYSYFDTEKSSRGVWVTLNNQAEKEELDCWKKISGTLIAATAMVWTPMGRSGFDQFTQRQICSAIRDRYGAVIFDPQTNSLLNPTDLDRWPAETGRQAASGLLGSAPPPAMSSTTPNSPTPPQCSPPPVPEGAAPKAACRTLPCAVRQALLTLIDYLSDEESDYHATSPKDRSKHVFCAVRTLSRWAKLC